MDSTQGQVKRERSLSPLIRSRSPSLGGVSPPPRDSDVLSDITSVVSQNVSPRAAPQHMEDGGGQVKRALSQVSAGTVCESLPSVNAAEIPCPLGGEPTDSLGSSPSPSPSRAASVASVGGVSHGLS